MNIAFFELEGWEEELVSQKFKGHNLHFFREPLGEKHLKQIENVEVLVVFIYSHVSKKFIEKLPNLKLIATMSTGFDHIDTKFCAEKNIPVSTVPTYGANTVAEHTFALILSLSRKLYPSIRRTFIEHSFETDASLRGFDLKGKTLGVIGTGHIGEHVIRMAKGFEMNVIATNLHENEELAKTLGFTYVDQNTLMKQSDIITLHVPYLKATHHLINDEAINHMKEGIFLINTSRGGLIDTHALIKGLESKKIAGAGLDVLESECEIKEERQVLKEEFKNTCDFRTVLANHMLMKMKNVIITPHNAFNSKEALERILETTLENIEAFISGKAQNTV